mgnify:CR=1 FL=1
MSDFCAPSLLAGQHMVVTCGGTGLGRAMALRFADLGAAVTINGRRPDPLAETVRDIEAAGGAAEGIQCNVRDYEAVQAFFEEEEDRQGPVPRLVHNTATNTQKTTTKISHNGFKPLVPTQL